MINNSIGGYFELELRQGEHFHKNAIKLNTSRNCLEYILKVKKYSKIYIPYYICEVILEPVKKCKVDYEFYSINEQLEPKQEYSLNENEAFLYTNYFGLKQNCIIKLVEIYGKQLIVDNSQAFFAEPLQGIDTFYSARKFFGVADGAYLYCDMILNEKLKQDISYLRMTHLLKRMDLSPEAGYDDFKVNDASLINQPILKMSKLTEKLLESIDYEIIRKRRTDNYKYLHSYLGERNLLNFNIESSVPQTFPFLVKDKKMKECLIEKKIFVPTYWNNVKQWTTNKWESFLVDNLIHLPIDQRIKYKDIDRIILLINNSL